MDLRNRIVAAYRRGNLTQQAVAERFCVSQWAVHKLCKQQRELGHLNLRYSERKPRCKITAGKQRRLTALLTAHPDLTLPEMRDRLGVDCTPQAIFYVLRRLGYTRKKRRYVPPNSGVPTLPVNARRGRPGGGRNVA